MGSEEDMTFEILDSGKHVMDIVKVQVLFVGIKKETLNMTGKVLKFGNIKIPITRFGSWVFHTTQNENDIESLISTGGPIVAFLFALYKSYPQITAWVDNPENGSFILDVEKKDKSKLLGEIAGKLKQNVQKYLSENSDLKINIIKIVKDKPTATSKTENPILSIDDKSHFLAPTSTKSKTGENKKVGIQGNANNWEYIKLKAGVKCPTDRKESKLKAILDFANCCCKLGKHDEVQTAICEIKLLSKVIKPNGEELESVLQSVRTLTQTLFNSSKSLESVEIVFASAELLKNIGKSTKRIESKNEFATIVCDALAKVLAVNSQCFYFDICAKEEIGISSALKKGSGTKWEQANKARRSGKCAFKKFDFTKALDSYDVAIALQPKEMIYHLDKAEVFLSTNKFAQLEKECEIASKLGGSDINKARCFALKAEAELRKCQPFLAGTDFEKSLDLYPNQDVKEKFMRLEAAFKVFHDQISANIFLDHLNEQMVLPFI